MCASVPTHVSATVRRDSKATFGSLFSPVLGIELRFAALLAGDFTQ